NIWRKADSKYDGRGAEGYFQSQLQLFYSSCSRNNALSVLGAYQSLDIPISMSDVRAQGTTPLKEDVSSGRYWTEKDGKQRFHFAWKYSTLKT
ncbi:hypothetical protein TNCV_720901, partial [Trichonephila clavipes]